jgi:hypothetical protein
VGPRAGLNAVAEIKPSLLLPRVELRSSIPASVVCNILVLRLSKRKLPDEAIRNATLQSVCPDFK